MSVPRVRERSRVAHMTSKSLRAHLRNRAENLTTDYLDGDEPTSQDVAAVMWDALYRAELEARATFAIGEEVSTSTDDVADPPPSRDDWPPPEPITLSTAGHCLTLAARAPGAARLFVA